ncbi:hypothetical protein [Gordonibacter sp.]|nr:hypothetical protein [Gordonibacter sp.]
MSETNFWYGGVLVSIVSRETCAASFSMVTVSRETVVVKKGMIEKGGG